MRLSPRLLLHFVLLAAHICPTSPLLHADSAPDRFAVYSSLRPEHEGAVSLKSTVPPPACLSVSGLASLLRSVLSPSFDATPPFSLFFFFCFSLFPSSLRPHSATLSSLGHLCFLSSLCGSPYISRAHSAVHLRLGKQLWVRVGRGVP